MRPKLSPTRLADLLEVVCWIGVLAMLVDSLTTAWFVHSQQPLTDPLEYPALARGSRWIYDTGHREPLHLLLLKPALLLWPPDSRALRALTLIESVLILITIAVWTRLRWGRVGALAAGASLSANQVFAYYSVQGFNMTTYMLALIAFAAVWEGPWCSGKKRDLALGTAAGGLALARLEGLVVAGLACALELLLRDGDLRRRATSALRIGAVVAAMVGPFFVHQWLRFGDPLHSHAIHSRFWANTADSARGDRRWQGTRSEGEPIPPATFLLRNGALAAAGSLAEGYRTAVTRDFWRLLRGARWALPLALIGFVWFLWRSSLRIPALLFLSILPQAFIINVDQVGPGSGIEIRFLLPAIVPLACLTAGGGACASSAFDWIACKLRNRTARVRKGHHAL